MEDVRFVIRNIKFMAEVGFIILDLFKVPRKKSAKMIKRGNFFDIQLICYRKLFQLNKIARKKRIPNICPQRV
jgi:hypothetical protein